jgi:hypothetical protein
VWAHVEVAAIDIGREKVSFMGWLERAAGWPVLKLVLGLRMVPISVRMGRE